MVQNVNSKPVSSECPDREALSDLALGKLPLSEIDRLEAHVDSCTTCQKTLETLEGIEDSILEGIREHAYESSPIDPSLEARLRLAEEIRPDSSSMESDVSLPLPEALGPYQLLHQLGAGGMGTVWKAIHMHLKRPVALKVLRTARHQSRDGRARFYREMEAVGRLDHPNLVRAHDAGIANDRDFLVMELVDGVDCRSLIQQLGPLSVSDACEIARQTAIGLQYTHDQGLIHRDIKPSNLMVSNAGHVKILDLGLARFHDSFPETIDSTEDERIVGTPDYIAPEQIEGTQSADGRADIYSLGSTLYFLLTGAPPYNGPSFDSVEKKLAAHQYEAFSSVSILRSDVTKELEHVLDRMVAKSPAERYDTPKDVADALAPFGRDANLAGLSERSPKPSQKSWPRTKSITAWLMTFLAVAFLTLTTWYVETVLLWIQNEGLLLAQGAEATVSLVGDQKTHYISVPTHIDGVSLPAGQYEVELADDDKTKLSASTSRITIQRGGKAGIQIRRISDQPAPLKPFNASSLNQNGSIVSLPDQLTNSIGMSLCLIPAGEFVMGSPESEKEREWNESPQHRVAISQPFYMGKFEVTQAEYAKVMGHNPSHYSSTGEVAHLLEDVDTGKLPVESIRWPDAVEFCKRLSMVPSEQEAGRVYRLPTEAEWEYACRAGTTTPYYHGDTLASGHANFKTNFPYGDATPQPFLGRTMPVGSFPANPWGLHEMHGNVWEWTSDRFEFGYYHRAPRTDPTGPESGEFHVMRGGGWGVNGGWCRSAFRGSEEIAQKVFYSIGFRVVCEIKGN